MIIEEQVIYKTLKDNDRKILSELSFSGLFENIIHQYIWKFALDNFRNNLETNFSSIRIAINQSDNRFKDAIHKQLTKIETGVYWYDESSLTDIIEKWQNRKFKNLGKKLLQTGTDNFLLEEAKEEIVKYYELIKSISNEKKIFISLEDVQEEILNRKEDDLNNYRLNISNILLKKIFSDYMLPRFYIIAGLPSMGKNIIVDKLVCDFLLSGKKGVYFSYDNSALETGYMMQHILSGISYNRIESGILEEWERQKILNNNKISKNLYITSKRLNIDKIRIALEKLKGSKEWQDIRFFVIDYFQNIPFRYGKRNSEVIEFEHMAREINKICNDLKLTGIILSQSNDREKKEYVKFNLTDLKWCGGLGQDAFYVIGLEGERKSTKRIVKIAKNKRGMLKDIEIEFNYMNKEIYEWESRWQ